MYEKHFGFSGTPFSLNPDPSFFFQSKGHGNALSYLRFGVFQGEGFVVVTGEIGAGKTTLVRALLSELDERSIVAAQIVSTQLEAGDLLRSVAIAFGLTPKNLTKAELIASIEAFLTLLVTQNKRALLIVDEAQNLGLQAIEELRMLSNFQLGNHALLQSFLVGQPELRELLTSRPMEQFRQRVIASCHLGPMDALETRAYVQHRLEKVGWNERPAISADAFGRIHERTSGIPRRVNLLCNRLLLSAYLSNDDCIESSTVDSVADDASAELGAKRGAGPGRTASADVAATPFEPIRPARPSAAPAPVVAATGPVVCISTNRADDIKMAMLLDALRRRQVAPPVLLVRIGSPAAFALNDAFFQHLGVDVATVELDVAGTSPATCMAEVMQQFEPLIDLHDPAAMILVGHSDAVLACALIAGKKGRRLALVDSGDDGAASDASAALNRSLLERLVQLQLGPSPGRTDGERRIEGLSTGGLLAEAAMLAASAAVTPAAALSEVDETQRSELEANGYCLVLVDASAGSANKQYLAELLGMLRKLSSGTPLVWPIDPTLSARLESLGLRRMLRRERIALLRPQGYAETIALLGGADCVLTDSRDVRTQAEALDVPALMLHLDADSTAAADRQVRLLRDARAGGALARGRLNLATVPDVSARHRDVGVAENMAEQLVNWICADGGIEEANADVGART